MDTELLDRFALLEGFSQDQVEILKPIIEDICYQANQVIFEQGAEADYLYFVMDGKVSIRFKPEDGPELTVAELDRGGVFGWSSALGCHSYTSSAICVEESLLLRMEGGKLKKSLPRTP